MTLNINGLEIDQSSNQAMMTTHSNHFIHLFEPNRSFNRLTFPVKINKRTKRSEVLQAQILPKLIY